jgi:uncharacterized cofD-like protein
MNKRRIVVIGGGTGTFTVLSGLRKYPQLDLSVIVTMMDSGGSNRVIRDEFGLLPTSDIRQCMVALSSEKPSEIVRELFTYRYNQGTGISGMTFGNLFMAALTDIYGSQETAIEKTCEFLDVQGNILPVTYDDSHLVARYSNGKQVLGEHLIGEPDDGKIGEYRIVEFETIPQATANPKAVKAIKNADLVILSPGDLFTSVISNLVVVGIQEAIGQSEAKIVYVMNLMTKFGETNNYKAGDFIEELEKYLGGRKIEVCLVHKDGNFPKGVLKRYREEKAYPVKDNLKKAGLKVIRRNFVSDTVYEKIKGDKLHRSLIRHDGTKLAKTLVSLL